MAETIFLSVFSFIYIYPDLWDSVIQAVLLLPNPVCCSNERRRLISRDRNSESGYVERCLSNQLFVCSERMKTGEEMHKCQDTFK